MKRLKQAAETGFGCLVLAFLAGTFLLLAGGAPLWWEIWQDLK